LHGLSALFAFDRHGTTLGRETIAGLTTFTTMSYIVVVNPAILSVAGHSGRPIVRGDGARGGFRLLLHGFLRQSPVRHRALHGRERIHRLHRL